MEENTDKLDGKRDTVLHERDRYIVVGQFQRGITVMSDGSGEHYPPVHHGMERLLEHKDPTNAAPLYRSWSTIEGALVDAGHRLRIFSCGV